MAKLTGLIVAIGFATAFFTGSAFAQSTEQQLRDEIVTLKRALGRTQADLKAVEDLLHKERQIREKLEVEVGKTATSSADDIVAMRYRSALAGDIVACTIEGETRLDGDWTPFRAVDFTIVRGEAKAVELYSESRRDERRVFADLSADRRTVRVCHERRKGRCASMSTEDRSFDRRTKATLNANRLLRNADLSCQTVDVRKFR